MYGVYVVEQDGKTPFNRAMLMNVGAAEAVKQQVFIFLVFWLCFTFKVSRTTSASFSMMLTCYRRTTETCTPAQSNRGTCQCPLIAFSIDFPTMISLAGLAL